MPAQIHTKVFVHFEQGCFGVLKESAKKAPYMDFLYIQLDAIKKRWYCMNDINVPVPLFSSIRQPVIHNFHQQRVG